jgi:hypothetical protein
MEVMMTSGRASDSVMKWTPPDAAEARMFASVRSREVVKDTEDEVSLWFVRVEVKLNFG